MTSPTQATFGASGRRRDFSLSVVMPAHNAEAHIERTLLAVLALEPPAHEVVIVDDGSSDNTLDVVSRLSRGSTVIRSLAQPQQGVSSARNTGLAQVRGDYVLFLDSDDLIAPDLLARLRLSMSLSSDTSPDVFCWRFQHVDQDGSPLSTFDGGFSDSIPRLSTGPETLGRIVRDRSQTVCTISAAYRTDFLRQNGLMFVEGLCYGEDTAFIWRALPQAATVAWVDEVLSFYVNRPGSATSVASISRFDPVVALEVVTEFLKARPDELSRTLAPFVSERVVARFFGVLPLFVSEGLEGPDILHALEVRHPGLIGRVRRLICWQLFHRRRQRLARLLFCTSPRLGLAYLKRRYAGAPPSIFGESADSAPDAQEGRALTNEDGAAWSMQALGRQKARSAYVVMSHQADDGLLGRLVGSILRRSPTASVLVMHDARRSASPRLWHGRAVVVPHVHRSDWGSWELVEATLEGIQAARTLFDPDMVVVISGQDYPVRDLQEWEEEFISGGGGWMGSVNPLYYRARWGWSSGTGDRILRRYTYRWYTLPFSRQLLSNRFPAKAFRKALGVLANVLDPVFGAHALQPAGRMCVGFREWGNPLRHGVQCYYGSQWVAMDRERLDSLLDRHLGDERLRAVYQHSLIPDESYLQTILSSLVPVRPGPPISFYKYDKSRTRGEVLTLGDFEEILRSGSPFCRKVNLQASRGLMERLDMIQSRE